MLSSSLRFLQTKVRHLITNRRMLWSLIIHHHLIFLIIVLINGPNIGAEWRNNPFDSPEFPNFPNSSGDGDPWPFDLWPKVVLQFHLLSLNWCWHSAIASIAPSLTAVIISRLRLQSCLCFRTSPSTRSHSSSLLNRPWPWPWPWSWPWPVEDRVAIDLRVYRKREKLIGENAFFKIYDKQTNLRGVGG